MPAERSLRDGRETGFSLIETMRWEPHTGLLRGELHFARLADSARRLDFDYSQQEAEKQLNTALRACNTAMRVRLELAKNGDISITTQPFMPLATGTVWQLRIAASRLDSSDKLLRYKTSRRTAYEHARKEFSLAEADEVLLLNEKGEVCEGTITSLFVENNDGTFSTPALSCGLLDGVLRRHLLMTGKAREAILMPGDLMQARRIFVGNSLRGLVPSQLKMKG